MSILDKLLEKKDLLIYIKYRIETLKQDREKYIEENKITIESRSIQSILERFNGRLQELEELKTTIIQGNLKNKSKLYYKNTRK